MKHLLYRLYRHMHIRSTVHDASSISAEVLVKLYSRCLHTLDPLIEVAALKMPLLLQQLGSSPCMRFNLRTCTVMTICSASHDVQHRGPGMQWYLACAG